MGESFQDFSLNQHLDNAELKLIIIASLLYIPFI